MRTSRPDRSWSALNLSQTPTVGSQLSGKPSKSDGSGYWYVNCLSARPLSLSLSLSLCTLLACQDEISTASTMKLHRCCSWGWWWWWWWCHSVHITQFDWWTTSLRSFAYSVVTSYRWHLRSADSQVRSADIYSTWFITLFHYQSIVLLILLKNTNAAVQIGEYLTRLEDDYSLPCDTNAYDKRKRRT